MKTMIDTRDFPKPMYINSNELFKKLWKMRPDKKKYQKRGAEYCYGYTDSINKILEFINNA